MYGKPKESDWKIYRKRVPEWRERYLEAKNREIAAMLADGSKTPTEQFWDTKERMGKEARILDECLGYFARSRMWESLLLMHGYGMIFDADLEGFSEELRAGILAVRKGLDG